MKSEPENRVDVGRNLNMTDDEPLCVLCHAMAAAFERSGGGFRE
jgi:nitrate/TMAO reductase-like tetraheme cytochrome c subunit